MYDACKIALAHVLMVVEGSVKCVLKAQRRAKRKREEMNGDGGGDRKGGQIQSLP